MVPLKNLTLSFAVLLLAGLALTLPLYKFNFRKFVRTPIFVKIISWVPIFAVLVSLLYADSFIRLVFLLSVLMICLVELIWVSGKPSKLYVIYYLLFAAGLAHLILLGTSYQSHFINLIITLSLATVLADVAAFFMGNYFGRHHLPSFLNDRKSWEGVAGELIGALAGILIVNQFIVPVISLWLFLPIGIGAIAGDLANSYVKRRAGIKDWSRAIPGHGGFIDRLSSLAGSAALTFYFLKLTGLH
jgi:phosphatidate cytidylyltransferase